MKIKTCGFVSVFYKKMSYLFSTWQLSYVLIKQIQTTNWLVILKFCMKHLTSIGFSKGSFPGLGVLKETANVSFPSTRKTQHCGEPPWPRSNVLGLKPPRFEFRILCLEDSFISLILSSSAVKPVVSSETRMRGQCQDCQLSIHCIMCRPMIH